MSFDEERWRESVRLAVSAATVLKACDLPALIKAGDTASAVGPVIDPTLYREKGKDLDFDLAILRAASAFVGTVKELISQAEKKG